MELLYEMWLHAICGFDPQVTAKAAPLFNKKRRTFSSPEIDMMMLRDIGIEGEFAKRFSEPEYFDKALEIIEYCKDNKIRIITRDCEEYPQNLLNTTVAPRLLFAKGKRLNAQDQLMVSVVGCRKPTDQGKVMARSIGRRMAENGIVVVSGMAEGIDAEAHWGAIEGGGSTIAVLAGSVDKVYPKSNERLYHEIIKCGTVISERPPGTLTKRYFYQQRNRIIVGLSCGTVFVEGKENSGTAITARLALENNRDLFAVPGSPLNWQSELPNRIIAEGAVVMTGPDTSVEYYKDQFPEKFTKPQKQTKKPEKAEETLLLSDDDRILNFLKDKGDSVGLEEMVDALGIAVNVLNGRLTVLSIKGYIRQESGNRYILTKK